jgi:hypothetical protein
MKRGYRLNSTAAFSRYAQARQANFAFGSGLLKAGINKVDDAIRAGGRKIGDVAVGGLGKLDEAGKMGGLRGAGLEELGNIGTGIDRNAKQIRNGIGIAGGLGAVGLGGAALANRGQQQQPRMY